MKYELWYSEDGCSYTLLGENDPNKRFLESDAKFIHMIEAESDNEACTKRNVLLGWEPYKPME